MKEFVSDHRISLAASVSVVLLGWAIFAAPGGSWPGMLSIAALATLLVASTAVMLISRSRENTSSVAHVIQDVDTEPTAPLWVDWKGKAIL